jgi:hypothetical protein
MIFLIHTQVLPNKFIVKPAARGGNPKSKHQGGYTDRMDLGEDFLVAIVLGVAIFVSGRDKIEP